MPHSRMTNPAISRRAPALLLLLTMLGAGGCCGDVKEYSWRLLERHADATGSVRVTPNLETAEAEKAAVVIPGHVSGEMEVTRWNTYEVTKHYSTCPSKRER